MLTLVIMDLVSTRGNNILFYFNLALFENIKYIKLPLLPTPESLSLSHTHIE